MPYGVRVIAWLVLVTLGCAADAADREPDELVISKVTVRDFPIAVGQMLSVASLCFEVPLALPHDCTVSMREPDGADHVIPACAFDPDARPCFRIVEDLQNCVDADQLKLEIVRTSPPEYVHHLAVQCVSY